MNDLIGQKIQQSNIPRIYIYRMFAFCDIEKSVRLKDLVKLSRLPMDLIKKILKSFDFLFESPETQSDAVRIQQNQQNLFRTYREAHQISQANFNHYNWVECETDINIRREKLKRLLTAPFKAKRSLDQFLVNIDTLLRRSKLLVNDNPGKSLKILFLGDDDCTSVALAHLLTLNENRENGKDQRNWEITVIDIDEELIEYIQKIATDNHLSIKLYQQDLQKNFSSEISKLIGTFDVVFTDPPYTINGMGLFLYRALHLLKIPMGRIFACFGYSIQEHTMGMKFQELLTKMHLYIESIHENFNIYEGAYSIGATSNLFKLKPITTGPEIILPSGDGTFYTGYNSKDPQSIQRSEF